MADLAKHEIRLHGGPMNGETLMCPLVAVRLTVPGLDGWYTLKSAAPASGFDQRTLIYVWQEPE